jgi:DNA-binding NarL/FixJ family response regulator
MRAVPEKASPLRVLLVDDHEVVRSGMKALLQATEDLEVNAEAGSVREAVDEAEIRRLCCRRCKRVRTEQVPWARPGARHSRDLEDVVAFLAQRVIVTRVVTEAIDDARLDELYRIGVDEISYRKGHRYLTVVADHDRQGAVVWAAEGHDHPS